MRLNKFFFISLIMLVTVTLLYPQQQSSKSSATKAKGVADYYKASVRGIYLTDSNDLLPGQILAFRSKGIIFKRSKQGPFYNPQPQYIAIRHIKAFVDKDGKSVWGEIPVTKKRYDFLKIRKYRTKIGLQYGLGRHSNSYTFSPLIPDVDNYIQNLNSGQNFVGRAAYFLTPHYSVGFKYIHHITEAELYSLRPESETNIGTINDDITIQGYLFEIGFYRSIARMIIFHADIGLGGLIYENKRHIADDTIEISGTSFSTVVGGGADFLLTRNVALGFELSYLFGRLNNPSVSDDSQVIEGHQNLNRFDINVGVNFYF